MIFKIFSVSLIFYVTYTVGNSIYSSQKIFEGHSRYSSGDPCLSAYTWELKE